MNAKPQPNHILTLALLPLLALPCLGPLPVFAQTAPEVIVDETAAVTIYGPTRGHRMSREFAAGDLTGNGIDDLAIGNPIFTTRKSKAGRVYVLFAPQAGWPELIDLRLPREELGLDLLFIDGLNENDGFGSTLTIGPATGLISDATRGDLVVSARLGDGPAVDSGRVYVFRAQTLQDARAQQRDLVAEHDADVIIGGAGPGDKLGVQIALGDFGSDNVPDLLITAPLGERLDDRRMRYRAYLVRGGPALLGSATGPRVFDLRHPANPETPEVVDGYTYLIANFDTRGRFPLNNQGVVIDDVDGDGFADVVLGNPFIHSGHGRVYVIQGGPHAPARQPGQIIDLSQAPGDTPGTPDYMIRQPRDNDAFLGTALAVGDVLGDGQKDLVIGAALYDDRDGRGENQAGAVFVLAGGLDPATREVLLNAPDREANTALFTGGYRGDNLGQALALVPSATPGVFDLAAGAPLYFREFDNRRRHGGVAMVAGGQSGLVGQRSIMRHDVFSHALYAGTRREQYFGLALAPTSTRVNSASGTLAINGAWAGAWDFSAPDDRQNGALFLIASPFQAASPPLFEGDVSLVRGLFDLSRRWYTPKPGVIPSQDEQPTFGPDDLLRLIENR